MDFQMYLDDQMSDLQLYEEDQPIDLDAQFAKLESLARGLTTHMDDVVSHEAAEIQPPMACAADGWRADQALELVEPAETAEQAVQMALGMGEAQGHSGAQFDSMPVFVQAASGEPNERRSRVADCGQKRAVDSHANGDRQTQALGSEPTAQQRDAVSGLDSLPEAGVAIGDQPPEPLPPLPAFDVDQMLDDLDRQLAAESQQEFQERRERKKANSRRRSKNYYQRKKAKKARELNQLPQLASAEQQQPAVYNVYNFLLVQLPDGTLLQLNIN